MGTITVFSPSGEPLNFPDTMTEDEISQVMREQFPAPPSTIEDVARSTGAGVAQGAAETAQLMGSILPAMQDLSASAGRRIIEGAMGLAGREVPARAPARDMPPAQTVRDLLAETTGGATEYEPQTTAGEYGRTLGQFAGGAAVMPVGGPLRALKGVVAPAVVSETAGQLTKGTEIEGPARLAAALGTPFATSALRQGAQRALLGPEARITQAGSDRAASVSLLEEAGVPMTTGLKAGSPRLMALEGSMEPPLETKKGLTEAVMRSMGSDKPLATGKALSETKARLGKVFDEAESLVDDVPSMDVGLAAEKAITDHLEFSGTGTIVPKLKAVSDQVTDAVTNQVPISGKKLQNMRSDLRRIMSEAGPDDQSTFQTAFQLNSIIDDFLINSVGSKNPDFVPDLMTAREQYRNFLTTMRAKKIRGSDSAGGYISPAMLSGALRNREGDSYILGTGSDLARLGSAAEEVISSMPATKAGGERSISGLGGILGGGGGIYAAAQTGMDPTTAALVGGSIGAGIPAVGRRVMQSAPVQGALMPTRNDFGTQMLLDMTRSGIRQTGGLLNIPQ